VRVRPDHDHRLRPFGVVEVSTARAEADLAALREFGLSFEAASEPLARGDLAIMAVHEATAAEGLGERFAALAREYRAWLLETFGAGDAGGVPLVSGEAFDATWWNLVVHPETGEWQLIDREWRLELPVPADYVLWRMLTAFFLHHVVQLGAEDAARPPAELVAVGLSPAPTWMTR
jgi:hypothetical protein